MKKILMLLALAVIISCSLDNFKSEDLASWSINLDFPLFKTNYTVAEMLNDYDELTVESYENDSIYVFNASTPHNIDVPDYTITKVGNVVVPIPVPIVDYEFEIPTLPEELNGINFVDVDLTLEVDLSLFNVSLADSVIVNSILLTAMNEDGDIETATITNQDILIDGTLIVEDPEDLINIRPTSIVVSGSITIYPSDLPGEQVWGQTIILTSNLHAPLILEITETSTIDTTPEQIGGDLEGGLFEAFTLFAEIDNQMELGGNMRFLVSPDTMNFKPNSPVSPDTLFSIQLLPDDLFQKDTIELGPEIFDLLADSTYMKTYFEFIGMTDAQGDPEPTRFFTNDSIKVLLYGSAVFLVDPQNVDEEE
ncbi:MAG: hypothetical protein V3W20_06800 [Candidatus Neomarinimicrobiota bacterium]